MVTQGSLASVGSQPAPGSIVHARLLTPLDSMSSTQGEKVEAVLEEPLFSADHKLVLPEGTLVDESVVMTKRARWFHRGGHLRFNFQSIDLTPQMYIGPCLCASKIGGKAAIPNTSYPQCGRKWDRAC